MHFQTSIIKEITIIKNRNVLSYPFESLTDVSFVFQDDNTRFGSDIELKVRSHAGEEECHDAEIHHKNDADICSRIIVNTRSSIYEYVKRHNQFAKRLFYIIIHAVLIGYLAAATKIYLDNGMWI